MKKQSSLLIDIATRDVICLSVNANIGEVACIMTQRRFSSVVITDAAGHPVGIVTERNILHAMRAGSPQETKLHIGMSSPVIVMPGTMDSLEAYQTCMREGIRHLVLVDDDGVVTGVVSETDFRLHLNLTVLAGHRLAVSVASRSVISLPPHASLMQALNLMHAQREACVIVVEDEKPVGIVTERDMVRFYSLKPEYASVALTQVMTSPVLTISNEASINQAAERMLACKVRHLAVVDAAGRMLGLVSEHDLTQTMVAGLLEEKFEVDEMLLRTVIDTIPDLVWLKDAQGVYMACNRRFELLYGAKETEIIGKTDYDFVAKQEADDFREHDLKAMASDSQSINEEWLTFAADGYRGLFETIKTPLRDSHGKQLGVLGVARDITERKKMESALFENERRYRKLVENSPFCIHEIDLEGRLQSMNRAGLCMLGLNDEKEIRGASFLNAVSEQDNRRIQALMQDAYNGTASYFEFTPVTDTPLNFKSCFIPIRDADAKVVSLMGLTEDITERKRAEAELRLAASVFDNTQEAITITDAHNIIIDVNPAFTRITGYSRDEVLGKDPKMLGSGRQDQTFYAEMWRSLKEKQAWRGEIWNRRKNGEVYAELLSISAICDETGEVQRHVAVFSDITYFKEHEAELSRAANYDALTGIPNRRLLADRLEQAIAHAQRSGKLLAICYIDLDGFKSVNDQYGHAAGDRLLMDITRRLHEVSRAGDTLARLGGDEFVVLLNELSQEAECYSALDRIMHAIAHPMLLNGNAVAVSASIGVTFYPANNEDGDTLLRHADQAMYVAKQTGKNRYHLYDAIHDQRVRSIHESRQRVLQGLENGEFELYYQPKLELATNIVVGVEALIRWNHPERGLLLPADFLHLIENSEAETRLGIWVLDHALVQLHAWEREGVSMEVSINIAARHLQSPDFVAELQRKMAQYPALAHGRLQIEVLETAALDDMSQTSDVIDACRKLGVSFALDDFGTGYSSLVYLRKLSADTLKIDQSFVQDMATNESDRAIVQGVIALAKTFGRKTVAEGMEDPKLLQQLTDMGCGYGQGYSIARPMPAEDFISWFQQRKSN